MLPESAIARVAAGALVGVLLFVQISAIVLLHVNERRHEVNSLVEAEYHRLEAALSYNTAQSLNNRKNNVLDEQLIGLLIASESGIPVVVMGEIPDASDVPKLVEQGIGEWSMRDSHQADVMWQLDTATGPMSAIMRVDVASAIATTWSRTKTRILYALGLTLLIGLLALSLVNRLITRYFVKPTEILVEHIESWQGNELDDNAVNTDEACAGAPHLMPIAETVSDLISQQKVADRQVRVKQKYLEFAAHHDPLTHLPNRLKFEDTLQAIESASVETGQTFSIFLVDLDNFKIFNDQYGHVVGDRMVSEIGNRLRGLVGANDLVARLDGDEFVLIKTDIGCAKGAKELASQIMDLATEPFIYRGFTMKVSVSLGISCYPNDLHSEHNPDKIGEEIVNNASVALQEAKTSGKNQFLFFNESMRSKLTERLRLEADLKTALQDGQFEVWYQPKINIQTRKVIGAEALVRWNHPEEGFISPEVFVPVAEEAGLIIELGKWILRTACQQTQDLQRLGYEGVGVAVNISAVQFTDGNLIPMVRGAMEDSNLSPRLLELEITESAVMHDPEDVIESLHQLNELGLRLAIDDFGTGYSSLAYLKRFPVDTLKIDRAFIMDVSSDNDDVAIVEAVLGLGKHFDMKVVAEGVEDEDQLRFLKDQGCDIAQGYFISRPLSYSNYVNWMANYAAGYESCFDDDDDQPQVVNS